MLTLTPTEAAVLKLRREGKNSREISREVRIGARTCRKILANAERKMQETQSTMAGLQYVDGLTLACRDGKKVGPFSSHWAACAAMIRLSNPAFRSLGGDKPDDLSIEAAAFPGEACIDCWGRGRYDTGEACKCCAGSGRVPEGSHR